MMNDLKETPKPYDDAENGPNDCCAKCISQWEISPVDGFVTCANWVSPNFNTSCSPSSVCNHFRTMVSEITEWDT